MLFRSIFSTVTMVFQVKERQLSLRETVFKMSIVWMEDSLSGIINIISNLFKIGTLWRFSNDTI